MSVEGELLVRLRRDEPELAVSIQSTRPLAACKSFVGKSGDHLLDTLPLLYSICGQAQQAAALAALEAASGMTADPATAIAREMVVLAETAREHAWRILLDWPAFLEKPPNPQALAPLVRLPKQLSKMLFQGRRATTPGAALRADGDGIAGVIGDLERALEGAIFGIAPAAFFGLEDGERLLRWQRAKEMPAARMLAAIGDLGWDELGAVPLAPLPELGLADLEFRLGARDGDGFITLPEWDGLPRETTPRTRQARHPLLAGAEMDGLRGRLLALLLELSWVPLRLRTLLAELGDRLGAGRSALQGATADGSDKSGTGGRSYASAPPLATGIGIVEAARGRLVHRAMLDGGLVSDYRILAPTEWNFHPKGAAALALKSLSPETDRLVLERQAKLLIHAIDPCVGFQLAID